MLSVNIFLIKNYAVQYSLLPFILLYKVGDRAEIQGSNGGGNKSVTPSTIIKIAYTVIKYSNIGGTVS